MIKTQNVKVGTCGFGLKKTEYAEAFPTVEIQNTFYQPPLIRTLERWREQMPGPFEFTLKAWQLITHDTKSPTYRRLKLKLSESDRKDAGYFRPTRIVREAWEITVASAKALGATTILFQCPASFTPTAENIENMENFFGSIERHEMKLCWEPRGNWNEDTISSICSRNGLTHAVDPFVTKSVTTGHCYFRLHGKTGWRYQYEVDELTELARLVAGCKSGFVFFNNRTMSVDGLRFSTILSDASN